MYNKFYFLVLLATIFCIDVFGQTQKYHRISASVSPDVLQSMLQAGLEIDHFSYEQDQVLTAEVSDADIQIFKAKKVKFLYLIKDLEKNLKKHNKQIDREFEAIKSSKNAKLNATTVTTPANFALGSYAGYYTFAEMQTILDQMRALFPNLISAKSSLGTSVEGRSVFMVKISDNPDVDEAEPEMFFNAVHHAREPISMSQMIFFMWHILENYNTDNDIKTLVNSTEFYFVPLVNPDGYVYNQNTNPNGGGLWRKNRKNNGNGTFGIDLNRNYGYLWGFDNTGSSPTSSADNYRGTAAFSEPETQIIRNFSNAHNFSMVFDYHAWGNYCIYPFGHTTSNSNPELTFFQQMSNFLTAENGFITGNSNQTLAYVMNGDATDWQYAEQATKSKSYSFLPEVGTSTDGFWPASSRILPLCNSTIEMNKKAFKMGTFFGKATVGINNLSSTSGAINYSFQNFSIKPTSYIVKIVPTSAQVLSVGAQKVYNNFTFLQTQADNISYTVDPSTPVGTVLTFELIVDNGLSPQKQIVSVTYNCADAPSNLNVSNVSTGSAQLNWNAVAGISSYTVEYKLASSSNWTIANASNLSTSIVVNGLSPASVYDWRVKSNCTTGFSNYSSAQFTTNTLITYCASNGINSTTAFIDYIKFGTINRISGSDGGYFNGSSIITNIQRGTSQPITYSSGFSGASTRQYWRVWIDYNNNGIFTDVGEQVISVNITGSGNGVTNFTIPSTVSLGQKRMRVASKTSSAPTPCQSFNIGEVEDYTINITNSAARISTEGLMELASDSKNATLFTNPVQDKVTYQVNEQEAMPIQYQIVTMDGRILNNEKVDQKNPKIEINVKHLPSAMYLINFEYQAKPNKSIKFLKE